MIRLENCLLQKNGRSAEVNFFWRSAPELDQRPAEANYSKAPPPQERAFWTHFPEPYSPSLGGGGGLPPPPLPEFFYR